MKSPWIEALRSVALTVPDLAAAETFYTQVWRLAVAERRPGVLYLRGSAADHHLLALHQRPGTLFPQPRLADGALMDQRFGHGWRLVGKGGLPVDLPAGITAIDLGRMPEADGVVAAWMLRHGAQAALVRPDHYTFGTASDAEALQALLVARQAALS